MEGAMDLEELRRRVVDEIDHYVYLVPEGANGRPWNLEKVDTKLREFRSALVQPYWVDIIRRDILFEEILSSRSSRLIHLMNRCVVVADDRHGIVLAFDPSASEFLLAERRADTLVSFGMSGDAVGCFLAC
jgi:hypothetical protein